MEGSALKKDIFLGRRVAVYRIDDFLGEGGFAYVYRARDTNLDIDVALKVLKPAFAYDEVFEANFRREAHRAAKFRHPNVIAIHYAGKEQDIVFFSMDLLETGLSDLLGNGHALDAAVIVKVGMDVASALQFAHTHEGGIVHRDLKPDNILFDRHGNAVVTDFGIAEAATNYTAATGTTVYVGTPRYMSPEQARGQRVDHRSDIYSLGVTLYEMSAGAAPFEGRDWFELGRKHIEELPPLPRERNPHLNPELERIILKCLQKLPADRYQTAEELRADLAPVIGMTQPSLVVNVPQTTTTPMSTPATGRQQAAEPPSALFAAGRRRAERRSRWPGALAAAALLVGTVAAFALDLGGLRGLGEARFPWLAEIPVLGSGTVYMIDGPFFEEVEGGAEVDGLRLSIQFSGALDPSTAVPDNVKIVGPDSRPIGADIRVAGGGRTLVVEPSERLSYETQYTVRLEAGLLSARGTPISQEPGTAGATFGFRTRVAPPDADPPFLAGSSPASGYEGFPSDQSISVRFSEAVLRRTVNAESVHLADERGNEVGLVLSLADDNETLAIQPARVLDPGTRYALTLAPAITDWVGNALVADSIIFTTRSGEQAGPGAPALLSVGVSPPQATDRVQLVVDGRKVGYVPVTGLEISSNVQHTIELIGTDVNSVYTLPLHNRQLMLKAGERFEMAQEVPPFGSLTVSSTPYADVYIDGRRIKSTPLAGFVLAAGQHTLELHPTAEHETQYGIFRHDFTIPPFEDINLGNLSLPRR